MSVHLKIDGPKPKTYRSNSRQTRVHIIKVNAVYEKEAYLECRDKDPFTVRIIGTTLEKLVWEYLHKSPALTGQLVWEHLHKSPELAEKIRKYLNRKHSERGGTP